MDILYLINYFWSGHISKDVLCLCFRKVYDFISFLPGICLLLPSSSLPPPVLGPGSHPRKGERVLEV